MGTSMIILAAFLLNGWAATPAGGPASFENASLATTTAPVKAAATFDHAQWDKLVQKHVNTKGQVDYAGFRNDPEFSVYLKSLSAAHPSAAWPVNERKAFWINAYNAFTIKLIIDHPGVKSIKDIPDPWKIGFILIGGKKMDLDHIENVELRANLADPRIHFAIVCASRSCPMLWDHAYTAAGIDKQLDDAARRFINDPARNNITGKEIKLSKVFQWFNGDFTKGHILIAFLDRYATHVIPADASISYLDYDWGLNGKYRSIPARRSVRSLPFEFLSEHLKRRPALR